MAKVKFIIYGKPGDAHLRAEWDEEGDTVTFVSHELATSIVQSRFRDRMMITMPKRTVGLLTRLMGAF